MNTHPGVSRPSRIKNPKSNSPGKGVSGSFSKLSCFHIQAFRYTYRPFLTLVFSNLAREGAVLSLTAALFPLEETNGKGNLRFAFLFAVARLSDILHGNYRPNGRNLPLHRTSSLVSITQVFFNCNRFDKFFSNYFVNVL